MKSQRYQILPRLRQYSSGIWICVFKDPGALLQRRGSELRFTAVYTGIGTTAEQAIRDCRHQYMMASHQKAQTELELQRLLRPKKVPDHCLATSNLPWWKRLFRV